MAMQHGTLKQADHYKIQNNYTKLLEDIEPNFLTPFLYQEFVISLDDKEEIEVQKTRRARADSLLTKVLNAGPGNAFSKFIEALKLNGYDFLAELLEGTQITDTEQDVNRPLGTEANQNKQLLVEQATTNMTYWDKLEKMRQFVGESKRQDFLKSIPTIDMAQGFPGLPQSSREQIMSCLRQDGEYQANIRLLEAILKVDDFWVKLIKFFEKENCCMALKRALEKKINDIQWYSNNPRQTAHGACGTLVTEDQDLKMTQITSCGMMNTSFEQCSNNSNSTSTQQPVPDCAQGACGTLATRDQELQMAQLTSCKTVHISTEQCSNNSNNTSTKQPVPEGEYGTLETRDQELKVAQITSCQTLNISNEHNTSTEQSAPDEIDKTENPINNSCNTNVAMNVQSFRPNIPCSPTKNLTNVDIATNAADSSQQDNDASMLTNRFNMDQGSVNKNYEKSPLQFTVGATGSDSSEPLIKQCNSHETNDSSFFVPIQVQHEHFPSSNLTNDDMRTNTTIEDLKTGFSKTSSYDDPNQNGATGAESELAEIHHTKAVEEENGGSFISLHSGPFNMINNTSHQNSTIDNNESILSGQSNSDIEPEHSRSEESTSGDHSPSTNANAGSREVLGTDRELSSTFHKFFSWAYSSWRQF